MNRLDYSTLDITCLECNYYNWRFEILIIDKQNEGYANSQWNSLEYPDAFGYKFTDKALQEYNRALIRDRMCIDILSFSHNKLADYRERYLSHATR